MKSLKDMKMHMSTGAGGTERFRSRVRKFLDGKADDELWGSQELASGIGYSYSHFMRCIAHTTGLEEYKDRLPGGRPVYVFGSRKAIANFRDIVNGEQNAD